MILALLCISFVACQTTGLQISSGVIANDLGTQARVTCSPSGGETASSVELISPDGQVFRPTPPSNRAVAVIPFVQEKVSGTWTCRARNSQGGVISATSSISFGGPSTHAVTKTTSSPWRWTRPTFFPSFGRISAKMDYSGPTPVGSELQLDCLVSAPAGSTIIWYKNYRRILSARVSLTSVSRDDGLHHLLTIKDVQTSDAGRYRCEVWRWGSVARAEVRVIVPGVRPTGVVGRSTTPPPRWWRWTRPTPMGWRWTRPTVARVRPTSVVGRSTTPSPRWWRWTRPTPIRWRWTRPTAARPSTNVGIRSTPSRWRWTMPTAFPLPRLISAKLEYSGPTPVGSRLQLDCLVSAPAGFTVTWYKNNRRISSSDERLTSVKRGDDLHHLLTISSVQSSDAGGYRCEVRSGRSVARTDIRVFVRGTGPNAVSTPTLLSTRTTKRLTTSAPARVSISVSFRGLVMERQEFTLDCLVSAPEGSTTTWSKQSTPLAESQGRTLSTDTRTDGKHYIYTVSSAQSSDTGLYTCEVTSPGGRVIRSYTYVYVLSGFRG